MNEELKGRGSRVECPVGDDARLMEGYRALIMGHGEFRNRHGRVPRFKRSKRRQEQTVSCYDQRVLLARKYLKIARQVLGRPVRLMEVAERYQALRKLQDTRAVTA